MCEYLKINFSKPSGTITQLYYTVINGACPTCIPSFVIVTFSSTTLHFSYIFIELSFAGARAVQSRALAADAAE